MIMNRCLRITILLVGLVAGLLLMSHGEGITADPLIGSLEYSELSDLEPQAVWMLIDQAEYWAIPLEAPLGYYGSVQTASSTALKDSLHALIDQHTVFDYSTKSTPEDPEFEVDTWDIIALADAHPEMPSCVLDLYLNGTFTRQLKGTLLTRHYDREHSWPKSLGFNKESCPAYTDCHHLFAAYSSYNSSRSNKPYGSSSTCSGTCKAHRVELGPWGQRFRGRLQLQMFSDLGGLGGSSWRRGSCHVLHDRSL